MLETHPHLYRMKWFAFHTTPSLSLTILKLKSFGLILTYNTNTSLLHGLLNWMNWISIFTQFVYPRSFTSKQTSIRHFVIPQRTSVTAFQLFNKMEMKAMAEAVVKSAVVFDYFIAFNAFQFITIHFYSSNFLQPLQLKLILMQKEKQNEDINLF